MTAKNLIKVLPALLLAALASCISDIPERTVTDEDSKTVTLSIRVPGGHNATRALADNNAEYQIGDVDVLQFTTDGRFAYRAAGYDLTGSGANRTFRARLLVGNYDLVIIANARARVNAAESGASPWNTNTTTQDALDKLKITVLKTDKLTSGGIVPALPMFGIKKGVTVDKNLDFSGEGNSVGLVRMLAKIDVSLTKMAASGTDTGTGTGNFRLAGVSLYNHALEGWVAPKVATWPLDNKSYTEPYFGGGSAPAKACYTASPGDAPIVYSGSADNVTDMSVLNSIYTFENPRGLTEANGGRATNVCVVVGGYYQNSPTPTYYRVDFVDSDSNPIALVRNYNYTITVNSVKGAGYPTADEAYKGTVRFDATVVKYNPETENIIFDGQYSLEVSDDEIDLAGSGRQKILTAETNYDLATSEQGLYPGLRVTALTYIPAAVPWLTMTDIEGDTGSLERKIGFSATPNTGGASRAAQIHLTAGNMTKVITITQGVAGILAPPGVVGYTEETHELTMRGSRDYEADDDLKQYAEDNFGGLHEQTVYVAYFKFGSLIAMNGRKGEKDPAFQYYDVYKNYFKASDVVWAPDGYVNPNDSSLTGLAGIRALIGDKTDSAAYTLINNSYNSGNSGFATTPAWIALGVGDVCTLADKGASADNWMTPTGNLWNGGEPFANNSPASDYWNTPSFAGAPQGILSDDGTMFLPAAGLINVGLQGVGEMGRYWSRKNQNYLYAYGLSFNNNSTISTNSSIGAFDWGFNVRCVPEPAPLEAAFSVHSRTPDEHVGYEGGPKEYFITSHNEQGWSEPWTAEFSEDGGESWSEESPSWITGIYTSGNGTLVDYVTTIQGNLAEMPAVSRSTADDELRSAGNAPINNENGTEFYDLSTRFGSVNTANCYVINTSGRYKLPLVYGNALKNGADNPSAYKYKAGTETAPNENILSPFMIHDGSKMSGPYINNHATPGNAILVWEDSKGLITNVNVSPDGNFLVFDVKKATIAQGNAIVAVRDNSNNILWSWHIWVTPMSIFNASLPVGSPLKTNTSVMTSSAGTAYEVMNYNLGWVATNIIYYGEGEDGTRDRSVMVRYTQTNTGSQQTITISQDAATSALTLGNNPFYQWGRKDPMAPGLGTFGDAYDKPTYGELPFGINGVTIDSPYHGIANPDNFFTGTGGNGNWYSGTYDFYNLWDADKTNYANSTAPNVKTVYDPSPVGFKVPNPDVFTRFSPANASLTTIDGLNSYIYTDPGAIVRNTSFLPLGGRYNGDGSFTGAGDDGYYRTALFPLPSNNGGYGRHTLWLTFPEYADGGGPVQLSSNPGATYGFSVRPVAE